MAKFSDAVRATLTGYFNAGDQPTEAQFTALILAIQEGIEEHDHDGTGDGDGINFFTGDLGIGVAPTRRLHVFEATVDTLVLFESGDPAAIIELKDDTTTDDKLVSRTGDVTNFFAGNIVHLTLQGDGDVAFENGSTLINVLVTASGAEQTLDAAGAITITHSYHSIDTFGDAAADNLVTINGASEDGQILILRTANSARVVTVKDTGNIVLDAAGDFVLDHIRDRIMFQWHGAKWLEISRSDNS